MLKSRGLVHDEISAQRAEQLIQNKAEWCIHNDYLEKCHKKRCLDTLQLAAQLYCYI